MTYTIKSFTAGRYWSFPVNLNTFEELTGHPATEAEFQAWLDHHREPLAAPARNSEEVIVSQIGRRLYQMFFEGYTLKQWQRHPRDLDPAVCARIPLRTSRDDRYLRESFQALPAHGYTALFERILEASPRTTLHLNTPFSEARQRFRHRHLVFTGPIDEYYGHRFGPLPYRSLRFQPESFTAAELADRLPVAGKPGFWQPVMQVNFPDPAVPFTRIVEIKHATGQQTDATTIIREFPKPCSPGDEPYYPVPAPDARAAYQRYAALARREPNTSFLGRLANYRYYNMDQVTALALTRAAKLIANFR